MRSFSLFLILSILTTAAFGGTQTGVPYNLYVRATDGLVYFWMNGAAATNRAPCASNTGYWMIQNENSNAGKMQLAQIIAAIGANQTVTIVGSGQCTRWPDGEDISNVIIQ
ncbi:MAG: hypothetical protein KGO49_14550 [Gammaproteobacteria bacterium]|nr:hypothetical protein [Gammaproteobacteria bacterium]